MIRPYVTYISIILIGTLVTGCGSTGSGSQSRINTQNPQFDSFKKNFASSGLPLVVKGCNLDMQKYAKLIDERYPAYVTNEEGYILSGYALPANGDYTALLSFIPADCYVPMLTTYDKDGKKIDGKIIAIGGSGSDCGFTCEEFMVIRADYSIYTSDTVTYIKCDTAGNEIPTTREHYVIYKKGKLLSSGKIELSGEIKEPLMD